MTADRDDAIVMAYAAGADPRELERLYDLSPGEVERIVAEHTDADEVPVPADEPRPSRNRLNRAALGLVVGFVVQIFAGLLGADGAVRMVVWLVVGLLAYGLAAGRG